MFLFATAAMILAATPSPLRILFIGNSHTQVNDLPNMLTSLLQSDGSGRVVETQRYFEPFLNDGFRDKNVCKTVSDPRWNVVVLQGAQLSSSHHYEYDNSGATGLAQMARKAGSRALFFVEWPRRGWNESDWQMDKYRAIAHAAPGSELVPVCYAWDSILRKAPNLNLWASDGNHASPLGTYLAANVFYFYLTGTKGTPTWILPGVAPETNALVRASARAALSFHKTQKAA